MDRKPNFSKERSAIISVIVLAVTVLMAVSPTSRAATVTTSVQALTAYPTVTGIGQPVLFTASIQPNPPSGEFYQVVFTIERPDSVGEEKPTTSDADGFASYTYTPTMVGEHLLIVDFAGATFGADDYMGCTDSTTFQVGETPGALPPTADFSYSPSEIWVGDTVKFDATGSYDPDGIITSYDWNFGDGNTGSGEIVTHAYEAATDYTVTLTVTDNDGLWHKYTESLEVNGEEQNGDYATQFPFWILAPVIGGIAAIIITAVYFKRRKPKEEVTEPLEPPIIAEPTEIRVPAKETEEVLKPLEEVPPQEVKELPKLSAKCFDTIALLTGFIEDPSLTNDRKAWKGFREFISIAEQIEDEYAELIEIRNRLAVLRRKRKEYKSAGLDDLADETQGLIQSNYVDSIRIIKEIQEKLPQLGG